MPANLGTLAPELLFKITDFFFTGDENPVPQLYLRLAQVNRRFYEVYMSDHLWKYLDVHRVEKSIAAHYLKLKRDMLSKELVFCAGFDYAKWRYPDLTLEGFESFSLYTQANFLASSGNYKAFMKFYRQIGNLTLLAYAARARNGLYSAKQSVSEDAEFMMKVADAGCYTAFYASDVLKDNKEFILKSVSGNSFALQDCSQRLKDDKEVVLAHIDRWRTHFNFASNTLRDDRDVVMAAVAKNPFNLEHCSERLRDDPKVVKAAVQSDGVVLEYASDRLKQDIDTVLAAVSSNPKAFEFAHESCRHSIIKRGASSLTERPEKRKMRVEK